MDRWKFEKLEVEGCDLVAAQETDEEKHRMDMDVERLGKALPFLGMELLEEGAKEAAIMLRHRQTERMAERKEKEKMMREIEREMKLRV